MIVDDRCLEDLDQRAVGRPCLDQQLGGAVDVVGAEDDVDVLGLARDQIAVLLGKASRHHDLAALPGLLPRHQVAEVAVQLVVGVLPDAAGVEDDDVGVVLRLGAHQPVGLQQAGDALGVVLVHLTPVGAHDVAAGHAVRGYPRRNWGRVPVATWAEHPGLG